MYTQIMAKVRAKYGEDLPYATLVRPIIAGTVNLPARLNNYENMGARLCTSERDFLYSTGRGRIAWYEPEKHGLWEIAKVGNDDRLVVRRAQGAEDDVAAMDEEVRVIDEVIQSTEEAYGTFALEAHLRDYLARNLPTLPGHDAPLTLYRTEALQAVEFVTDVGLIDILATHNGDFYVLELKVRRGPDATLGQLLRYMGWVKEHLAGDKNVFGVIIASGIVRNLRYAATQVPNVLLMEYDLKVDLRPVALHG